MTGEDPLEVFDKAMTNIMPVLEVKARRVGGANYQVPIEVRPDRRQTLGLRWLTMYTRARGEKTMSERLAKELIDASNNTGASVKRKKILIKWRKQHRPLLTTVVEDAAKPYHKEKSRKEDIICLKEVFLWKRQEI